MDPRLRCEQTPQQIVQLAAALAGDEPGGRRRRHRPQVLHAVVRRVVQVGHTGHRRVAVGERRREVLQVVDVPRDLQRRVQGRPVGSAFHLDERVAGLPAHGRAPLLELDHHVRRRAGPRVHPGQHHVRALAAQRQAVFEDHLDLAQPGVTQVPREHRQAAPPRPPLTDARDCDTCLEEVVREHALDLRGVAVCHGGKRVGAHPVQAHRDRPLAARRIVRRGHVRPERRARGGSPSGRLRGRL